jgi:hypothetical protein
VLGRIHAATTHRCFEDTNEQNFLLANKMQAVEFGKKSFSNMKLLPATQINILDHLD